MKVRVSIVEPFRIENLLELIVEVLSKCRERKERVSWKMTDRAIEVEGKVFV